jgi:GAF domain-containing protein
MLSDAIDNELRKLEAIIRIHHSIGKNLELEIVSSQAIKELFGVIDCDGCAILALGTAKTRILAYRGLSKVFETERLDTDIPAIQYPVQNKRAFFTGEVVNRLETGAFSGGRSVHSLISVPVVLNGEVKGIIYLDSLKKNAFCEEDVRFVELIAEEISLTIERSFIFSQVREMLGGSIER